MLFTSLRYEQKWVQLHLFVKILALNVVFWKQYHLISQKKSGDLT